MRVRAALYSGTTLRDYVAGLRCGTTLRDYVAGVQCGDCQCISKVYEELVLHRDLSCGSYGLIKQTYLLWRFCSTCLTLLLYEGNQRHTAMQRKAAK